MRNSMNSAVFSLGEEAYIVGGYLRDALLGKKSKDIDYIVRGNTKKNARLVYDLICLRPDKGTLVELKKEGLIRIALKDDMTLDFTQLRGRLEDNLIERDFTMNALAWSPQTGLIDPSNGIKDITEQSIRAISTDNFKNDPLRLLRVYRFAAELGWNIDIKTRRMVRLLKKEIRRSSPERITFEFFKLLNSKNCRNALNMAMRDGLIEHFLSITHKQLSTNIKALSKLESALRGIPLRFRRVLEETFSQHLTLHGLLRLEQVMAGSSIIKNRLRLSRAISKRLNTIHKLIKSPGQYNLIRKKNIFDAFINAKDAAFDYLILSGNKRLLKQTYRFNRIWKKSLLSSEEIIVITKIKEGVELGKLLYQLKKLHFEGRLKTKKDAIRWLEREKQTRL